MKNKLIICGPQGTFKTQIAENLTKKQVVVKCTKNDFLGDLLKNLHYENLKPFHPLPEKFVLIIEDVVKKEDIKSLLTLTKIKLRPKYSANIIEIDMPKMIIITQTEIEESRRADIINLFKEKPVDRLKWSGQNEY